MNIKINLNFFFDILFKENKEFYNNYQKNLEKCIDANSKLVSEINNKTNPIISSLEIDYQKELRKKNEQVPISKKKLIIGMGGSSAGTKAINTYLEGNLFFFDNYDPRYLNSFFLSHDLNKFHIYIISKSGNTFETLAMTNLTYQHLLTISQEEKIKEKITFIVEDGNNQLINFAKEKGIKIINHNNKIGGRYSVFSETTQLLFDFDPNIIADSATAVISKSYNFNEKDHSSPIVNAAIILTLQKFYNFRFSVNVLYNYLLKNYSYWFHQLFAESLGKNNFAMTPMTSICPKDHHSMMQLFLEGPKDKLFNIYPPEEHNYFSKFSKLGFENIENKTPFDLLHSQYEALVKTFRNLKIPHRIISYSQDPGKKVENLFELFSFNIIETIILGYAQDINPYDQPAVEQIKLNTFNS